MRDLPETRRDTNPLFNGNRMKLGVFGANVSGGCAMTMAEGRLETSWPTTSAIVRVGDRAGFEAMVSVGRWKGFGGPTNFNGSCFEAYTWAAGLSAITQRAAIFATSHVTTIHPILAAKQATTIDHISDGRFGLNVVCGWFEPEMQMFNTAVMEHDVLYDYAGEWLDVVRALWTTQDEFDYEGRFFQIRKGFHEPKPIQRPFPPVMNAGSSSRGQRFAAKYADMAFIGLRAQSDDRNKAQVDNLRRLAREEYHREVQVWGNAYVVCRPTDREALDYLNYYVRERGDWEAADNLCSSILGIRARTLPPEALDSYKFQFIAGWGGYPLVGTPERIVDELIKLNKFGIDGFLLSWVNYETELHQWIDEVLPMMEQAGLRERCPATG